MSRSPPGPGRGKRRPGRWPSDSPARPSRPPNAAAWLSPTAMPWPSPTAPCSPRRHNPPVTCSVPKPPTPAESTGALMMSSRSRGCGASTLPASARPCPSGTGQMMPCALAPTLTGCTSTYPPPKLRSCLADTSWTRIACVASIHGYSLADRQALLLGPDGEQVLLPQEVYRILVSVVEALREGKAVAVVPRTQRLTTQE